MSLPKYEQLPIEAQPPAIISTESEETEDLNAPGHHQPSAQVSQSIQDGPVQESESTSNMEVEDHTDAAHTKLTPKKLHASDGVFSNLSAKPEPIKRSPTEDSANPSASPSTEELPPSYEQVAADPTPAYFDDTIWTTQTDDGEVLIEGLPVGSFVTFLLSGMVSLSFQFVGFMLTYVLATSHAGRTGAKAGFGATLLQYGIFLRARLVAIENGSAINDPDFNRVVPPGTSSDQAQRVLFRSEWISYLLMFVGWFLMMKSLADYIRVRKLQRLLEVPPEVNMV